MTGRARFVGIATIIAAGALLPGGSSRAQFAPPPARFTIAQLHYGGGGDWYANPSGLPNLLDFIRQNTSMDVAPTPARVSIMDNDLFGYPMLYMTGHGNIHFTDEELARLRLYLTSGGFLHADDNYGMDTAFRREIKRVFPDKDLVEIPFSNPIYHCWFDFPHGMPKIHKHEGGPPIGYGIFDKGRLCVFYSYDTDLGNGWEDTTVYHDPVAKHIAALKMGTNIVVYAMTH